MTDQQWYIKHQEKILGPLSAVQLKTLASRNKIDRNTQVRLGDSNWKNASRVKGLFPDETTTIPEADVESFFNDSTPREYVNRSKPSSPVKKSRWLMWAGIIFLGIPFSCATCINIATINREPATPEQMEANARKDKDASLRSSILVAEGKAKAFLLANLKSPTTAKFTFSSVPNEGLILNVRGTVTSQNTFGAMLTKPFKCVFARTELTNPFVPVSYEFEGETVSVEGENQLIYGRALAAVNTIIGSRMQQPTP